LDPVDGLLAPCETHLQRPFSNSELFFRCFPPPKEDCPQSHVSPFLRLLFSFGQSLRSPIFTLLAASSLPLKIFPLKGCFRFPTALTRLVGGVPSQFGNLRFLNLSEVPPPTNFTQLNPLSLLFPVSSFVELSPFDNNPPERKYTFFPTRFLLVFSFFSSFG